MKTILASAALAALISAPAFAQGNSGTAKGMAGVLSGTPGIGGIAPSVSGTQAQPGPSNSGWGNAGSEVTTGTSVTDGAKSQGNGGAGAAGGTSDAD